MNKTEIYIGLDVHKETITAAVVRKSHGRVVGVLYERPSRLLAC